MSQTAPKTIRHLLEETEQEECFSQFPFPRDEKMGIDTPAGMGAHIGKLRREAERLGYTVERIRQLEETARLNALVAQGRIPLDFVIDANCKKCGPIQLDFEPSAEVLGCPWCFCSSHHKPRFPH